MLWAMARSGRMDIWRLATAWLSAAEAALLGRGRPEPTRALEACLALAGGGAWCGRCGASMPQVSAGAAGVSRVEPGPAVCAHCGGAGPFDGFVRLGRYAPPLDRAVRRVKEQAWHAMAHAMGVQLGLMARRELAAPSEPWIVVPAPADPWRRLARGIDHAHAIAQGVAQGCGGRVMRALRATHRSRQASMDRARRWSRRGRMRLRARVAARLRGRSVLLVDDIRTTSATLLEGRELLILAGVKSVSAAVVCVADRTQTPIKIDVA